MTSFLVPVCHCYTWPLAKPLLESQPSQLMLSLCLIVCYKYAASLPLLLRSHDLGGAGGPALRRWGVGGGGVGGLQLQQPVKAEE